MRPADGAVDETLEHRILLLDSGVEKERISISPLLVKEEVERDGTALANQVADSQLSVIMYLIALVSMSFAVWTMVQMRRIRRGEEVDESDQTAEVIENMDAKMVPEIQQHAPVTPVQNALRFRHKVQALLHLHYLQLAYLKDGLWNNGTIMVINIYKIVNEHLRYSDEWRRFNGHITREVGESNQPTKHANFRNKSSDFKVDKSFVITTKRAHK